MSARARCSRRAHEQSSLRQRAAADPVHLHNAHLAQQLVQPRMHACEAEQEAWALGVALAAQLVARGNHAQDIGQHLHSGFAELP